MFTDRQKLGNTYLDEFTKIGNLFDTLGIGYCVIDRFALSAFGIVSKSNYKYSLIVDSKNKDKTIRTLFKLNYVISSLDVNNLVIRKTSKAGDIFINICFGDQSDKKICLKDGGRAITLPPKVLSQERKEVRALKSGKGYFRIAPLEVLYLLRMNNDDDTVEEDLELIKDSGKMDIDKLFKLFDMNGLV